MRFQGRNLHAGLTGVDVADLHLVLVALGYSISLHELEHGVFGVATADAVAAFQREHALTDSAVVDETTARLLAAAADRRGGPETVLCTPGRGDGGGPVPALEPAAPGSGAGPVGTPVQPGIAEP